MVDLSPPSRARELTTPPMAVSASNRKALYKFDLPEALTPLITFSLPKGTTMLRRER